MLTFANKTTEWVKLEHNERLIVLFIRTRKWNNNTTTKNNTNNFQYVKIFILTHFMALVSFYTPWKQKTRGFLIVLVLGSIEKDQWHCNVLFVLQLPVLFKIVFECANTHIDHQVFHPKQQSIVIPRQGVRMVFEKFSLQTENVSLNRQT